MKAYAQSLRIAPKKANLIAKMVRDMSVPDATEALRCTHKKAARMIEQLLRSAVANASHNDKQDPQTMVIKSIVVNQGQAYRRGMPMARGRTRPFRKFLSHISLELGFPGDEKEVIRPKNAPKKMEKAKRAETAKTAEKTSKASPGAKNTVKDPGLSGDKQKTTSKKSSSSSQPS